MPYTHSPFQPGDLVETTEEYKKDIEAHCYYKTMGVLSYYRGIVSDILTVIEGDTKEPIYDIVLLDNGFSSSMRYFKKVE